MNAISGLSRGILLTFMVLQLLLPISPGQAEIYRWQDKEGHWHFSDSPPSYAPIEQSPIPERETRAARPPAPEAQATQASAPGADQSSDQALRPGGLLWRISPSGADPSYLLGTIHSSDPRVVRLRPAVSQALDQSERFIMEMVPDPAAMAELATRMLITDGRDLEALLGTALFDQVKKAMDDYGMPEAAVRNLKPWAAMAMLSMPKPSADPILDLVLYQRAVASGKPAAGLETAGEQLAVFDELSLTDQIDLLKLTLDHLSELPRFFDRLIQAYTSDDLRTIAAINETYQRQNDSEAVRRFSRRLNDDRNRRMLTRMVPYLRQGGSFIAVGALHLSGPNGLLQLLQSNGYAVTPVR